MERSILTTVAVALLLVTAGCASFVPGQGEGTQAATAESEGAAPPADTGATNQNQNAPAGIEGPFQAPSVQSDGPFENFTELYDETIDSVVELRTESTLMQGTGSGFVYHEDGFIVTNQHVVDGAQSVSVGFASGVWRDGTVVGSDVYTDLAVVRVDSLPSAAEPLPLAERNPEPGQPVAAIGSPLGFQGSITQGIVSGTNRSMPVSGGFAIPDTIQTDAAINPGNSGGPLVSLNGTVVGVNRAKAGDNIGFAISADVVQRVVPNIVENGSYDHSYMGISSIPVTPDLAAANDLNTTRGLMIVGVLEGGPADGALQPAEEGSGPDGEQAYVDGDVIVGIDDREIANQHELARYLLLHTQPGQAVQVTVLRDGERVTETISLAERPAPQEQGGV